MNPACRNLGFLAAPLALSACVVVIGGGESSSLRSDYVQSAPVGVAETVLDPFTEVDASAGAEVVIEEGAAYTLKADDRAQRYLSYAVEDGELRVTCRRVETRWRGRDCAGPHDGGRGVVAVTAPRLEGLEASSGASIDVASGMATDNLSVRASSGGSVDARRIEASDVTARASSGGVVRVTATARLAATASSGGVVRHRGDATVSASESSGGTVRSGG